MRNEDRRRGNTVAEDGLEEVVDSSLVGLLAGRAELLHLLAESCPELED